MKKNLIILFFIIYQAEAQTSVVADSLYALGDYTKAINEYAKLGDVKAQHQIARAYESMGNHAKAISQYEAVIKKDSSNLLAQFELGKIFDKTKKYDNAEVLFKELTLKSPENPEFFYYLGKSQQAQTDYSSGNEALEKAVILDSTHLRSIYLLGKYYVGVNEPSNAHKILDLGLRTAPNDVALINLKALAYFDVAIYNEAIPYFEKLLEFGEKKPFVYKKLGYSYANAWQAKKAIETYRELAKIPNEEPDAYLGLARVYLKEKQLDSAEIYFLKSIEERRYIFSEEYRSLGRIARLRENNKEALMYYTKAWQEEPTDQLGFWQVCVMADEYYKDPKAKLKNYEKLLSEHDDLFPFLKERAEKRVKELKEEIHFSKERQP